MSTLTRITYLMALASLSLAMMACDEGDEGGGGGGSSTPSQGPKNASFEVAGATAEEANQWGRSAQNPSSPQWGAKRKTGTGLVPSDGPYMMELAAKVGTASIFDELAAVSVFQDNVDLTDSTSLIFDFELSGYCWDQGIGTGSSYYPGTATIEILFQSSGTVVLWSRTYTGLGDWTGGTPGSQNFSEQASDETATIPATTQDGRLTLSVTTTAGVGLSSSLASPFVTHSQLTFRIDRIRVQ